MRLININSEQISSHWGLATLISLTMHGLILWAILLLPPATPMKKKVVQVDTITLAAITPKPEGGGGGQAGPPPPSQEKPKPPPPPPPKPPEVKPKPKPVVKPQPEPAPIPERLALPRPAPVVAPRPASSQPAYSSASSASSTYGRGSGTGSGTGTGSGYGTGSGTGSGSGSGTGSGAGAGTALQGYLAKVRNLLEKNKIYPSQARSRNEQGTVVVRFTIGADGSIAGVSLSSSSGSVILDQAAQETVRKVGRFPPIPAEVQKSSLTVQVPLAYRLHGS